MRLYIYIPARTREEQRNFPRFDPIPMEHRPTQVWSMLTGRGDPNHQHDPAELLVHGRTAFMHDVGHDWSWRAGYLNYTPSIRDGGEWLVIVLDSETSS